MPLVPPVASIQLKDAILYRALRLAQITRGPGRTANPEQFNDALLALNGLLDSLNIQHDAIFSINNDRYHLTPSKRSYSIGIDPLGVKLADFRVPVPIRIDQARLVLTASASPVYLPLTLATAEQWASITVRDVPTTVPQVMYCDYDYPIANLWFGGDAAILRGDAGLQSGGAFGRSIRDGVASECHDRSSQTAGPDQGSE